MTQTINQKGVLYLEKNRLQIYVSDKANILAFEIPTTITHDIEIFSKEELNKQLSSFIKTNAINSAEFVMVLAQNILFEKDFVPADPPEQKKFIDSVPFEYVSHKEYPITNGVRVVAANSDFYTSIKEILEANGSTVTAIVPYFAVAAQMNGLDPGNIAVALNQFNQLKAQSFISTIESELIITPTEDKSKRVAKKAGKEQYALFGVFGVLILVLGFMLLRPAPQSTNVKASAPAPTSPVVVPLTPTPSAATGEATITTAPEILSKEKVSIQITYDTSKAAQAKILNDQLKQAGYTNIFLTDGGSIKLPAPTAVFNSSLADDLKEEIVNIGKSILPDLTTQENPAATTDVIVTIGV